MTEPGRSPAWTLYCPSLPEELSGSAASSTSVKPAGAASAASSWHEGGFYLPDAEFGGWRFGLLQHVLHPTGLLAFVRSPDGMEATVVSDPHAPALERLNVPPEPGYVGAFRVALPSLVSLPEIVDGFSRVLPLLAAEFKAAGGSGDAA